VQLTYHTDYALRTLIYLVSRPGRVVSTREIAEHYGISLNHLIKVAKSLTQGGWLLSTRGVGGGIMLAEHTPDESVGTIVRYTENTDLVECFQPLTNTCPITKGCRLKPILFQARSAFFDVLDSYTVRDLARSPGELKALTGRS
jgi:Rrf2 family nitric oxide-sensitive transcriptional repressor